MKSTKGKLITFGILILVSSCAYRHNIIKTEDKTLSFEEHFKLATIYETKNQLDLALKEYKKAVSLNPDDARAYFGIGNIYLKMRLYNEAETSLLKAIELDSTKGVFFNNLSWVYIERGLLVSAYNAATRGLMLDTQRRYIYLDTIGVVETLTGNYKEAERLLIEAVRLIPLTDLQGQLHIYTHLFDLYKRVGNDDKAEEAKKKVEDLRRGMMVLPPP